MVTYILILFTHAGFLAHGDSMALATVPNFDTVEECKAAGDAAGALVQGTKKELRYVCAKQTNHAKAY